MATSPAVDLHYAVCLLYAYYMRTCRRSRVAPSDDCHFPPALIRLGLDRSLYGDLVRGRWSYLFDSMLWSLLHPYPHFRLIYSAHRVALAPHRSLSAVVHRTAHPLYIIIIIITIIVGIIIYIIPPSAFRSRFPPWPSFLCIFDFAHCGASSFRAWVSFDTGLSHSTAQAFFASSSSLQSCLFCSFPTSSHRVLSANPFSFELFA